MLEKSRQLHNPIHQNPVFFMLFSNSYYDEILSCAPCLCGVLNS
jgi:hypothetical protein